MARRSCVFCGSTEDLTREHVWPNWLYKALDIGGPVEIVLGPEGSHVRTMKRLDVTVREVCGPCNHGWLHDLEHAFRAVMLPALRGKVNPPTVLARGSQQVVATWAVKTWLLMERAGHHIRGGSIETPTGLHALRSENAPPAGTKVWIGAFKVADSTLTWHSSPRVLGTDGKRLVGVLGVFTIGAVLFHIFGPFEPPSGMKEQTIGVPESLAGALLQIWPNEVEEVRWPPEWIFTLDELPKLWPGGGIVRTKPR